MQNFLELIDWEYVDEAKLRSRKVYVHCRAGKSRSVTIVLGYLLYQYVRISLPPLIFLDSLEREADRRRVDRLQNGMEFEESLSIRSRTKGRDFT